MGSSSASVLKAIQPGRDSIDADELDYPDLYKIIKEKRLGTRIWQVHGSPLNLQDKIRRRDSNDDVSEAYLLQIAYRLQKARLPIEKKYWSKRYTNTSVGLYGRPKRKEVASLASLELSYFEGTANLLRSHRDFIAPIVDNYRSLASRHDGSPVFGLEERYKRVLSEVRDYYLEEYEEALACFDRFAPEKALEPYQVAECFYRALFVLESDDKEWAQWSVLFNDNAKLSVNAARKQINIGKYRAPIPYQDVKGLFAHEVLVHALRSLNGSKVDNRLATGLDGYTEFEEGLGALVGSAVNGRVSEKIKDRYVDIALALGGKHRTPVTRHELFEISYARAVTRCVTEGREVNLGKLENGTWEYVNRIYRGTLGNEYVGVFTKDVAYYEGFCKVADYLSRGMVQGVPIKKRIECLLQGKFDPSNRRHVEHARSAGIKVH